MAGEDQCALYDQVLFQIGQMSLYQWRLLGLTVLASAATGMTTFISIFVMDTPQFRCAVPGLLNDTFTIENDAHSRLVNASIPWDSEKGAYSQCSRYSSSQPVPDQDDQIAPRNLSMDCSQWVYRPDDDKSSIIAELDLVCDQEMYVSHANMMTMTGLMVASMVCGLLSDAWGRKTTFLALYWLQTISSAATAFISSTWAFLILRFLSAGSGLAAYMSIFVLCMELMTPGHRVLGSTVAVLGWPLGQMLLVPVAYLIRDWRLLHLVVSCPSLLIAASYFWFIPESPRWLITKHRFQQARAVLSDIARVNKRFLPDHLAVFGVSTAQHTGVPVSPPADILLTNGDQPLTTRVKTLTTRDSALTTEKERRSFLDLLRSRILAMRLVNLSFSWFVMNMVFYGVLLNVGSIVQGDVYLNVFFFGLIDILGILSAHFTVNRFGRKLLFCACVFLGGVACLVTSISVLSGGGPVWLNVTLSYIGKFGIAAGFAILWLFTSELLPTPLRQSGVGFCSFVGRIGGIISPYIATMHTTIPGPVGEAVPLIIFGTAAMASGFLSFFLPETINRRLPETTEDAEQMMWRSFQRNLRPDAEVTNQPPESASTPDTCGDISPIYAMTRQAPEIAAGSRNRIRLEGVESP